MPCRTWSAKVEPIARTRILVVDDEPIILMGAETIARSLGYDVLIARSARCALQELEADTGIDVLLTDFEMPGCSGAELARQAMEIRPGLGIVLVTGRLALDEYLQPGWVALLKPFTREEMASAVEAVRPAQVRAPGNAA